MIHELVIEQARPGHLPALGREFATRGWRLRAEAGGTFQAAWTSEFGALNRLYSLWEHADVGEIQNSRSLLNGAPEWRAHLGELSAHLLAEEFMVLRPVRPINEQSKASSLFDFRIYDIKPFHAGLYAQLLADVLPIRQKYSDPFGIWTPLSGEVHRVVHLWPYDDLDQRSRVRAAVAQEPQWGDFVKQVFPLLVKQQSSLLRPLQIQG